MNKKLKAFNMVEIMIVVCLLITTVILCLPTIFNNSREAKIISAWKRLYTETETNFEVFNISDAERIDIVCASGIDEKEKEIFKIISPYLNIDMSQNTKNLKGYHYRFRNGAQVPMQSPVFTRFFSYQENGNIVGFRWISCNCDEKIPCASVLFDMNGEKKPNRIGNDIFGFYIYKNRIEAFGAELSNEKLERECSVNKNGLNCSEYYLRGGKF